MAQIKLVSRYLIMGEKKFPFRNGSSDGGLNFSLLIILCLQQNLASFLSFLLREFFNC